MEFEKDSDLHQISDIETTISVSDYIGILNESLREYYASIIGEVGQVTKSSRGHVYFSLKDQDKESVIYCVIWKSNYELFGIELEEGMEIVAAGYSDIYELTGRLTFKADTVELVGEGVLKKAYDELKKKLTVEGIFDLERKRPLPEYPHKIGVLTSRHGAVIHDFINNLGKYGFHVKIMDSRVEGQQAVKELLLSMRSFRKEEIDALVIIRGGGSLESLMAFNNEALVREVSNFPVPVIAGIGHHRDVPLTSLAADTMESTPTATANILNKSWEQAEHKVTQYKSEIFDSYRYLLAETFSGLDEMIGNVQFGLNTIFDLYKEVEHKLRSSISKVNYSIMTKKKAIKEFIASISKEFIRSLKSVDDGVGNYWHITVGPSFSSSISDITQKLDFIERTMSLNDPIRQLRLGYSITRHEGRVIRTVGNVSTGDSIVIQVSDGEISSEVKGVKTNE
ncbi:exodeoxyribonuclease VII large subunit [Desulfobacterota bacterium AH_259_B03_O07]|nr:exodeoxyribonuclease VII large subunit [Desulfobacterota bacterium AH_259_B03_O07]